MITNVAELLRDLMSAEAENISKQGITHPPTIGAMYEGLTRDVLDRSLPPTLGLKVVHGFVEGVDGNLSNETDCMLVAGEGRKLPHVESFVWPVRQVIATFEVKKSLYGADLKDAFVKQQKIGKMFNEHMKSAQEKVDLSPVLRAFSQVFGKHLASYDAARTLPDLEKIVFHLLVTELLSPIRVIFGYEGYVDENGLRRGMTDFLEASMTADGAEGYGAFSLPNLIVCRSNSILKLNGHPYLACSKDDWWDILVSNCENPIRILIELIWTRLENQFKIELPHDDNLKKERLAPLLRGKIRKIDPDKWGWIYEAIEVPKDTLAKRRAEEWKPEEVNSNEWAVATIATDKGYVDVRDSELEQFAKENATSSRTLVDALVLKRILAWDGEHIARPIHERITSVYTPQGKILLSANANMTGEWLIQKLEIQARPIGGG
jgi:hypothetical protein